MREYAVATPNTPTGDGGITGLAHAVAPLVDEAQQQQSTPDSPLLLSEPVVSRQALVRHMRTALPLDLSPTLASHFTRPAQLHSDSTSLPRWYWSGRCRMYTFLGGTTIAVVAAIVLAYCYLEGVFPKING